MNCFQVRNALMRLNRAANSRSSFSIAKTAFFSFSTNFKPYNYRKGETEFPKVENHVIDYLKSKEKPELEKSLPVLNLKSDSKKDLVEKMKIALEDTGVFYINETGLDLEQAYYANKWFFSVPEEEKQKLLTHQFDKTSKNYLRGLYPLIKGDSHWKEIFQYGSKEGTKMRSHVEQNLIPFNDQNFKAFMDQYYETCQANSRKIMQILALAKGLDENFLDSWSTSPNPLSNLKMVHYPPRTDTSKSEKCKTEIFNEDGFKYTAYDHVDTGFMTMVNTFRYYGLQAKIRGEWITIPPKEDYLVVNFGYGLEKSFKREVKAVWHRVLDIEVDRHSFVFFFEIPGNHLMYEDVRDKTSPSKTYEDYFIERVRRLYAEWREFDI